MTAPGNQSNRSRLRPWVGPGAVVLIGSVIAAILVVTLRHHSSSTTAATRGASSPPATPTTANVPPTVASSSAPTTTPAPSTARTSPTTPARPTTSTPAPPPAPSATARITVRPVTAAGAPAPGYTVKDESDLGPLTCGETSPVAVTGGVYFCGASATDTVACFPSTGSTVLCLRDPNGHTLTRLHLGAALPTVSAPSTPAPQSLRLDNGVTCLIRDGGAWASVPGHPDWYGAYYCSNNQDVYGPQAHNGIDMSSNRWTVHLVSYDAHGTAHVVGDHAVVSASYVASMS